MQTIDVSSINFLPNGVVTFSDLEGQWKWTLPDDLVPDYNVAEKTVTVGQYQLRVNYLDKIYLNGIAEYDYDILEDPNAIEDIQAKALQVYRDYITCCRHDLYIVGYGYIVVDDSKIYRLSDAVNDVGSVVGIPDAATGAVVVLEAIDAGFVVRVASNGSNPDMAAKRGTPEYEDQVEWHLGSLPDHHGDSTELEKFAAVINTGKTAKLHVTYYQYKCAQSVGSILA